MGLALLLLFLAGEFLEQVTSSRPSNHARLRALAITFLFDLLLVPLNPNGAKMYFYPVDTLRSKAMQDYIAEWASPNFHHAEYILVPASSAGDDGKPGLVAIARKASRHSPVDGEHVRSAVVDSYDSLLRAHRRAHLVPAHSAMGSLGALS